MRSFDRYCIFFFIALVNCILFRNAYCKASEVCVSQGGRFPPYSNEGKPPKKASKGPRDLTLCRVFRKKTCCDVTQTHPAFVTIRKLATSGEASPECLQLWELLECSICDPRVGIQRGPPRICSSLCDRVYEACSTAYFAVDAKSQDLAPCGLGDFVCGRASEWVSNGTELCHAAGFSVRPSDESLCYGGKGSLDYIANSWKSSNSEILPKEKNAWVLKDYRQWIADMPFSERVSWAVGGMVLTAGLLFARSGIYFVYVVFQTGNMEKGWARIWNDHLGIIYPLFNDYLGSMQRRKTHNYRKKQAAIQRTGRKLGTKMNPTSPVSIGNRKGIGR